MVLPFAQLPDVSDGDLLTTMSEASYSGDLATLQWLLPRLRVTSTNITVDMQHILQSACYDCHIDIIEFMLDEGTTLLPHIPARVARAMKWDPPIPRAVHLFKRFLDLGWDVNFKLDRYGGALLHALGGQNLSLVQFLIENGADPNGETKELRIPGRLRCFGYIESTRPLNIAAASCSSECIQMLLNLGARLEDSSPFHVAAAGNGCNLVGRIPILRFLLEKGMNIDAIQSHRLGDSGMVGTALQYAAAWGNVDIVRFLLESGADPMVLDSHGRRTALEWAKDPSGREPGDNDEVICLLTEAEIAFNKALASDH